MIKWRGLLRTPPAVAAAGDGGGRCTAIAVAVMAFVVVAGADHCACCIAVARMLVCPDEALLLENELLYEWMPALQQGSHRRSTFHPTTGQGGGGVGVWVPAPPPNLLEPLPPNDWATFSSRCCTLHPHQHTARDLGRDAPQRIPHRTEAQVLPSRRDTLGGAGGVSALYICIQLYIDELSPANL